MAYSKTLTTTYKNVEISFDIETKKFSIKHEDLKGEWDTLEAAEKAVRVWLNPTEEAKAERVTVFVTRCGGAPREATTTFKKGRSYYRHEIWVTYPASSKREKSVNDEVAAEYVFTGNVANRAKVEAIAKLEADKEIYLKANREAIREIQESLEKVVLPKA